MMSLAVSHVAVFVLALDQAGRELAEVHVDEVHGGTSSRLLGR